MNICVLLDMAADGFGNRTAIGTRSQGITAEQLRTLSIGGARLLRDSRADALLYFAVNGPAFPVALFSAARAGIPLVPMNYRLSTEQVAALLTKHPRAMAIAEDGDAAGLFDQSSIPRLTAHSFMSRAASSGVDSGDTLGADADAPAVIIYTSGTTAEPKGVLLRHHHLSSYVFGSVEFGAADETDASLVSVPPYHIAAVANTITNLYAGRRYIVLEQFTGPEWLNVVRDEQVTHALVVPTMLGRIMTSNCDLSVPSLRSLAYGGASMPVQVIERALKEWPHVDFVNAYGLTETSSTVSVLGPDEHRAALAEDDPVALTRLTSAGRPVPGVEIQIRDGDGVTCRPGERGRIYVRGEQVSGEYAGSGSALDEHGFFDTRDEGHLDEEGYLFVAGRADDTIIRGGENIAPADIEAVLMRHECVTDAVVVGVPDPEWGHRIEAAVVLRPGDVADSDSLRAFAREHLRSSKTPDRIVVLDELPRTVTGKILRRDALKLVINSLDEVAT